MFFERVRSIEQSLFDSIYSQTESLVKKAEKTLIQKTESNKCQKRKKFVRIQPATICMG